MPPIKRFIILIGVLWLMIFIYFQMKETGLLSLIGDVKTFQQWMVGLGYAGPVVLITLMALAIIINPIPSAPIALAAGAAYGHFWGTIYVVIGASLGAVIAFGLARFLGEHFLQKYLGAQDKLHWLGSQNRLTALVFISRLVPFISFDLVSYGAGLTNIKTSRFLLATILGLIPASFILAHFGGELTSANMDKLVVVTLLLGVMVLVPLIIRQAIKFFRNTG